MSETNKYLLVTRGSSYKYTRLDYVLQMGEMALEVEMTEEDVREGQPDGVPVPCITGVEVLSSQVCIEGLTTTPLPLLPEDVSRNAQAVSNGTAVVCVALEAASISLGVAKTLQRSFPRAMFFFSSDVFICNDDDELEVVHGYDITKIAYYAQDHIVFTFDYSSWILGTPLQFSIPKVIGAFGVYGIASPFIPSTDSLRSVFAAVNDFCFDADYCEYWEMKGMHNARLADRMYDSVIYRPRPAAWYGPSRLGGEFPAHCSIIALMEKTLSLPLPPYLFYHAQKWVGLGGVFSDVYCQCGCRSESKRVLGNLHFSHYWGQAVLEGLSHGKAFQTVQTYQYEPSEHFACFQVVNRLRKVPLCPDPVRNAAYLLASHEDYLPRGMEITGWTVRIAKLVMSISVQGTPVDEWVSRSEVLFPGLFPGIWYWEGCYFSVREGVVYPGSRPSTSFFDSFQKKFRTMLESADYEEMQQFCPRPFEYFVFCSPEKPIFNITPVPVSVLVFNFDNITLKAVRFTKAVNYVDVLTCLSKKYSDIFFPMTSYSGCFELRSQFIIIISKSDLSRVDVATLPSSWRPLFWQGGCVLGDRYFQHMYSWSSLVSLWDKW